MNEFFNRLKEGAEKIGDDVKEVWDSAKESFEQEAADENAALSGYHDLFAWADGSLLAMPYTDEQISSKDAQMKTLAVLLVRDRIVVSPCAATVARIEPAENTIVLDTDDGTALAIKVCLSAVSFESDADILVSIGQSVTRGQPLVEFRHPIEAKSKLLLLEPKTFGAFKKLGFLPAAEPGSISKDEIVITSVKDLREMDARQKAKPASMHQNEKHS